MHGLTATLWGRMSFTQGQASPDNFDRYRMMRMRDMPVIAVQVMASTAAPGGVGEPGVPPIAPAVANAWARPTGTRVRSLPMLEAAGQSLTPSSSWSRSKGCRRTSRTKPATVMRMPPTIHHPLPSRLNRMR